MLCINFLLFLFGNLDPFKKNFKSDQKNCLSSAFFSKYVFWGSILFYFKKKKNLRDFLSPGHDWVVAIKSRNFFYCESLVLSGFLFWSIRGCILGAHSSIHASFILRRGLTRFHLPKITECWNPSDILEWGPGAILIGNITLISP